MVETHIIQMFDALTFTASDKCLKGFIEINKKRKTKHTKQTFYKKHSDI